MTEYAGMILNIKHRGKDGRTAWERRKGRKFGKQLMEFGTERKVRKTRKYEGKRKR